MLTQLINYFTIGEDKALVDLPGYGYAKVPSSMRKHWQTILPAYLQERQSLVGLIIVMDIRRPLTELDTRMLDWFRCRAIAAPILFAPPVINAIRFVFFIWNFLLFYSL